VVCFLFTAAKLLFFLLLQLYPARGGQVKFWRIYFFDLQGAKRRHSQSYGEHLQRGRAKKERDKNQLVIPCGVFLHQSSPDKHTLQKIT